MKHSAMVSEADLVKQLALLIGDFTEGNHFTVLLPTVSVPLGPMYALLYAHDNFGYFTVLVVWWNTSDSIEHLTHAEIRHFASLIPSESTSLIPRRKIMNILLRTQIIGYKYLKP